MRVLIKEFKTGEFPRNASTLYFSCFIQLTPEYTQTLFHDSYDDKNMGEHAEHIGEAVKQEIIKHILNQNKDE